MVNEPITVTVVGGGNSAHVLIPFLCETGHTVNLMTRKPASWNKTVSVEMHCDKEDNQITKIIRGTPKKISSNPADVIPESDVIILCMPVHTYRDALHKIAPHLNEEKTDVFIGTIFGQAGFNWMVHEIERKFRLKNIVVFACGLIPWICRTVEYGKLGAFYGGKVHNIVAVTPPKKFDRLNEILLDDVSYTIDGRGKFLQACSFLSLTLSVDNQIIHPTRCYGLWKRYGGTWDKEEDIPFFYKDYDELSADFLTKIDADYTAIRDGIRKYFPQRPFHYMLDYLALERFTHESGNESIQKSFKNSKQLSKIKTPCIQTDGGKWNLNTDCRFFTDDIPYGLLIAKWIAIQLDVETPFIDEIIEWAQGLRGDKFIKDGKILMDDILSKDPFLTGIPPVYGITSLDDILD